jgi:hypothetical protein
MAIAGKTHTGAQFALIFCQRTVKTTTPSNLTVNSEEPVPATVLPLTAGIRIPPAGLGHTVKTEWVSSLGPRDPDLGHEHDNTVGASVKANTFLRRIFITDHSYMGLGPPNLQPGDEIHVLLGGRTPFVLRPVHAIEGPVPFFLYMLVGDCYLHGFMDGEAFIKCTVGNEGNVFMTKAAQRKVQKFPYIGFWLLHAVQLHTSFCLFTAEGEMPLRSLV